MESMDLTPIDGDGSIELGSGQDLRSEITFEAPTAALCPHCYRHVGQPPRRQSQIHPPVIPNSHATHAELQDAINAALENQLGEQNYDEVKVLLLNWEDMCLKKSEYESSILEQTVKLKEVFQNDYHYDVEHYFIPSVNPYFQLLNDISETIRDLADKSGNSIQDGGQLMWSAHKDWGPALSWYDLQRLLETALVDVLLLLDCDQSIGPTTKGLCGTMEVLAGSSREHKASGLEKDSIFASSFTHTLAKHLREQASHLHGLLVTELQALLSLDKTLEGQSPIHGVLKRHGNPIKLRPLLSKVEVEETASRKYCAFKASRSPFVSIRYRGEGYSKPVAIKSELKALVSVSFRGEISPHLDDFIELSSTQRKGEFLKIEIQALNIGAALDCRSSMVLFSMPVTLWAHLEDLPGCSLIGFVKTWSS
ncbi:hypothetical protein UA08_02168 [Talaromyces atroroseus]|uniref:Uncharacterized protein n=1 Tax=Talaromyces atroroseus TaxID=1441469 RepID=A0A225AMQ2_TALAT|nr:hypothetical protein UA08_02168 [Talaromyces atroroseus]OKL62170.1 hypothetical protein UA08_02168 [Talaromyces atroroseus]